MLLSALVPGPTLTAASAASMLVGASPAANQSRATLPAGLIQPGTMFDIEACGIISCAVTSPGTGTWDFRIGGTIVWSSGALTLNAAGKTNVPWWLKLKLATRQIGATNQANLWAQGLVISEALIGGAVPSVGGNTILNAPVTGLAVSSGFDSTISNLMDMYYTPSLSTGSLTCEIADITLKN